MSASPSTAAASACDETVASIMTRKVLTAKQHWSCQQLADFFSEHRITGAPVVDINDQLVGVITVTDLIKVSGYDRQHDDVAKVQAYFEEFIGQAMSSEETELLMEAAQGSFTVADIMSPTVLHVHQRTSVQAVARRMVEEHVHRIFVTDGDVLVGIVSTMDVLRYFAR